MIPLSKPICLFVDLKTRMQISHQAQGKTIYFDKKELLKWMRNNHITPARKDSANK